MNGEELHAWLEERAAIREFDGHQSRADAEAGARQDLERLQAAGRQRVTKAFWRRQHERRGLKQKGTEDEEESGTADNQGPDQE